MLTIAILFFVTNQILYRYVKTFYKYMHLNVCFTSTSKVTSRYIKGKVARKSGTSSGIQTREPLNFEYPEYVQGATKVPKRFNIFWLDDTW